MVLREWGADNRSPPSLLSLAIGMVALRLRGGLGSLRGVDAWYHYRAVEWSVANYPRTLQFDPFTAFPVGKSPGQFGTLYDLTVATVSLALGGGEHTRLIFTLAPVVFGALTVFPVYYFGRRLTSKPAALFGAAVFALQPGLFYQRTLAGMSDHTAPMLFLMAIAAAAFVTALQQQRSRRRYCWAVLSGVAIAAYLDVWPPGLLLVGMLGLGIGATLSWAGWRGRSLAHPTAVTTVTMLTAALLVVPGASLRSLSYTHRSGLHVFGLVGVALACLACWVLARHLRPRAYVTALGTVAVAAVGLVVASPLDEHLAVAHRFVFLGSSVAAGVGETRPFPQAIMAAQGVGPLQAIHMAFGASLVTAALGFALFVRDSRHELAVRAVVGSWSLITASAAFTQIRFTAMLAIPVAVLNAVLLGYVADAVGGVSRETVVPVGAVALLVCGTLAIPLATADTTVDTDEVDDWRPALEYLAMETPDPGLSYTGAYGTGSVFAYPDSAYGVLSWWDYGHWITTVGERPAVANPFQDHNGIAAAYFLAPNASAAERQLTRVEGDGAGVRYIVVDERMVATDGLLPAIAGTSPDVARRDLVRNGSRTGRFWTSQLARLYYNTSTQPGYETVYEANGAKIIERAPRGTGVASSKST